MIDRLPIPQCCGESLPGNSFVLTMPRQDNDDGSELRRRRLSTRWFRNQAQFLSFRRNFENEDENAAQALGDWYFLYRIASLVYRGHRRRVFGFMAGFTELHSGTRRCMRGHRPEYQSGRLPTRATVCNVLRRYLRGPVSDLPEQHSLRR